MEIIIPYKPRDYQEKVYNHTAKYKVCVWHRQCGKTTMAVNILIRKAIENPNKVFWYVAPTYRQAKDVVWKNPEMLFYFLPKELIKTKNEVELSLTLINGSVIQLKGADNPDSLRGNRPRYIVMDEYGDMKEDVWDLVLRPIMTAQEEGEVLFIGTPKGKNHFYKIYNFGLENRGKWQSWLMKASESKIISQEALDEARSEMPESAYLQEFECDFLEDASAVFKNIDNCISIEEYTKPNSLHRYKLGVDLAKYADWTVITALNLNTFCVENIERFNKIDWSLQEARIEAAYRRYNNARTTIDSTGVGDPIFENLSKRGILCENFVFTQKSREDLLNNLMILLEQGKIRIPNNPHLIEELKSFRYELKVLSGGRTKIYMGVPEGLNDDCVMSLALAVWDIPSKPYNADKKYEIFNFNKKKTKKLTLE